MAEDSGENLDKEQNDENLSNEGDNSDRDLHSANNGAALEASVQASNAQGILASAVDVARPNVSSRVPALSTNDHVLRRSPRSHSASLPQGLNATPSVGGNFFGAVRQGESGTRTNVSSSNMGQSRGNQQQMRLQSLDPRSAQVARGTLSRSSTSNAFVHPSARNKAFSYDDLANLAKQHTATSTTNRSSGAPTNPIPSSQPRSASAQDQSRQPQASNFVQSNNNASMSMPPTSANCQHFEPFQQEPSMHETTNNNNNDDDNNNNNKDDDTPSEKSNDSSDANTLNASMRTRQSQIQTTAQAQSKTSDSSSRKSVDSHLERPLRGRHQPARSKPAPVPPKKTDKAKRR